MSLLEKSSSIEISRRTGYFEAKKGEYKLGQVVKIEVDTQREYLDFENARCRIRSNFTTGTPTGTAHSTQVNKYGASALIKNLRVKTLSGQMIDTEQREYRAYCRMIKELMGNSDLDESYNQILEGSLSFKDATAGITSAQVTSVTFHHRFLTHLFSVKEYYPAHFHQGLMIEFDLPQQASEIFNIDHADATQLPAASTISFDMIEFQVDLVQLKPEIETAMVNLMEQGKLFVDYTSILSQENDLSASTGTQSYDIVGIDGRIKQFFQYTILGATQLGFGASNAGDYLGTRGQNNLTQHRLKIGADYINERNVNYANPTAGNNQSEQIFELVKAMDLHDEKSYFSKLGSSALGQTSTGGLNLSTNNFVVGVKVAKAMKNIDNTISSRVDKDRNNLRIELTFSASPGANATSYNHVVMDKRIQLLPGSIVRNVRS